MKENLEDLPTPRGLEKMMQLQAMEQEVQQLRKLSEGNPDNEFNSSLFPESVKNFEKIQQESDNLICVSMGELSPEKENTAQ